MVRNDELKYWLGGEFNDHNNNDDEGGGHYGNHDDEKDEDNDDDDHDHDHDDDDDDDDDVDDDVEPVVYLHTSLFHLLLKNHMNLHTVGASLKSSSCPSLLDPLPRASSQVTSFVEKQKNTPKQR